METIDVELGEFTRRSRSVVLRHTDTSLRRGLEPGEEILVRDPRLGYFAATVADIDFELADTVYRVELGVRLSIHEAAERALRPMVVGAAPVGRQELLDLLGQLRSVAHTLQTGLAKDEDVAVPR
ncbi:MAG TPA: hypothetical protein VGE38_12085 [Nocardioides sp.]|uniref:hypothetical protein n=1 Tax=Nocardioides sp. TaxID=35761 RepID=UPI002ED7C160